MAYNDPQFENSATGQRLYGGANNPVNTFANQAEADAYAAQQRAQTNGMSFAQRQQLLQQRQNPQGANMATNGLSALSGMTTQQIQALNQQYPNGAPQLSLGGPAAGANMTHYGPANAGVTVQDFGGGQQDNLLRAGLMKNLGNNPYFPAALGGQMPATGGTPAGVTATGGTTGGAPSAGGVPSAGGTPATSGTTGVNTAVQPGSATYQPGNTSYSGVMQAASPATMNTVPQTGLMGSEAAMQSGLAGGLAGLQAGVNQATGTLAPYTSAGGQSNNLQAALSGALGPQAQAQAFQNYNESPEVAYQREMGERAITRNAAATGGLGGSRVQQELQRHAIGLAQQDYGNAFNRLGSLSDRGANASNQLGGIQANAGAAAGGMGFNTGQALASGRTRAGEMIAGNVANTSQGLAGLMNQQGGDLSSLIGNAGGNIANLLAGFGQADAQTQQALAALLANIASGSASTVAGTTGLPTVNDPGVLQQAGDFAAGIATLFKPTP